jgi:hypothetical protein
MALPLYKDSNYQLTRESPETAGEFVERQDGAVTAGWEMRVPARGPDGVPFLVIFVGPDTEHRGAAIRLQMAAKGGAVPDNAVVRLETYHESGAERTVAFEGMYGEFAYIADQHAPDAAVSVQERAEAGEDYIIRLSVTVPADGPEPDPTAFESFFELDCTKLWWFESA